MGTHTTRANAMSRIEWTDRTWNPVTGCDRVSPGCDNCYALTMAARLKLMGQSKYQNDGDPRTSGPGFGVTCHPDTLNEPLRWRKPSRVFVNSMSDLFHPHIPIDFVADVFAVMSIAEQHTFQVLTKRPQRMARLLNSDDFKDRWQQAVRRRESHLFAGFVRPNIWLGTSVENQRYADLRIPHLLATPAAVRFLSVEPLLGPVDLTRSLGWRGACGVLHDEYDTRIKYENLREAIDWVIVGGESGRGARPMHVDWARNIRDQCYIAGVPFFFKQWGGPTPKAGGRVLDGRTWDEMPDRVVA